MGLAGEDKGIDGGLCVWLSLVWPVPGCPTTRPGRYPRPRHWGAMEPPSTRASKWPPHPRPPATLAHLATPRRGLFVSRGRGPEDVACAPTCASGTRGCRPACHLPGAAPAGCVRGGGTTFVGAGLVGLEVVSPHTQWVGGCLSLLLLGLARVAQERGSARMGGARGGLRVAMMFWGAGGRVAALVTDGVLLTPLLLRASLFLLLLQQTESAGFALLFLSGPAPRRRDGGKDGAVVPVLAPWVRRRFVVSAPALWARQRRQRGSPPHAHAAPYIYICISGEPGVGDHLRAAAGVHTREGGHTKSRGGEFGREDRARLPYTPGMAPGSVDGKTNHKG